MSSRTAEPRAAGAAAPAPAAGRVRLRRLMLIAAWFALLAGLAETGVLAIQQQLLDRIIYRSAYYLWMPAAGAVIIFVLVALVIRGLARLAPRLGHMRAVTGVFLGLTVFSILMVPRWFHPAAAALLSIGLAFVVSERLTRDPPRFMKWLKRTFAPLLATAALLCAISFAYPALRERSTLAALPRGASGRNIVFVILDTVRSKSLSLYGYERPTTPNLAALAQRGVVFDLAIAPAPWTLPTHASFFTGKPPRDLSADRFVPLDATHPTLAERLGDRGYATGGFVANLAYASYEFGLSRGFHHWDDYQVGLEEILTNSSLGRALLLEGYSGGRNSWLMRVAGVDHWIGNTRTASNVNGKLLAWIDDRDQRPFLAFANYFDAHVPYLPAAEYLGRYGAVVTAGLGQRLRQERPGKWPERGDATEEAMLRDRYEEAITGLDSEIGALVRELEARGLLDNTILVITADHGEEFGEHGFYEHDSSVFLTQVHVPLLIVAPGRAPANHRVRQPVSLVDLPATLLELSTGESGVLPGEALTELWSQEPAARRPVVAELDKQRQSQAALITPQYHYIRFKTGEERLFDHVADRSEQNNLATTRAGSALLPSLRALLQQEAGDKIFRLPANRSK